MPEGDTIHRAARRLGAVLIGHPLRAVYSTVPAVRRAPLAGQAVGRVEARGKNLLMHFEDGRVLYTHMKMTGAWHVYKDGDPWRKPPRGAKVILHIDHRMAVCFNAPVVELLTPLALKRHPVLAALGPDLLDDGFEWSLVAPRLAAYGHRPVGEALLTQQIACGIGNVYKSETLFLCGQDPFVRLDAVPVDDVQAIYAQARRLMALNLGGGMRDIRRRDGGRYWVYGRSGEQCRKCGERVEMRRQGDNGRSTYFCPACQGVRSRATRSRP